jgi:hypothetical protein
MERTVHWVAESCGRVEPQIDMMATLAGWIGEQGAAAIVAAEECTNNEDLERLLPTTKSRREYRTAGVPIEDSLLWQGLLVSATSTAPSFALSFIPNTCGAGTVHILIDMSLYGRPIWHWVVHGRPYVPRVDLYDWWEPTAMRMATLTQPPLKHVSEALSNWELWLGHKIQISWVQTAIAYTPEIDNKSLIANMAIRGYIWSSTPLKKLLLKMTCNENLQ